MKLQHGLLAIGSILGLAWLARSMNFSLPRGADVKGPVQLELADTDEKRAQGLMNRHISDEEGMLFVYPQPGRPVMWMKSTPTPLDIIFLSADDTVLDIQRGAPGSTQPIRSTSTQNPSKVLEVKEGWFVSRGLKVGDKILL